MPAMMESAMQPFTVPNVEDFREDVGRHQQWMAPSEFGGTIINSYDDVPPKKRKPSSQGQRERLLPQTDMFEKQQHHPIVKQPTETYGRPEDPWESSAEFKGDYSSVSHIVRRGSVGVKSVVKWAENFRSTPATGNKPKPKWNSALKRDVGWSQDPDEPRKRHYKKMMERTKHVEPPLAIKQQAEMDPYGSQQQHAGQTDYSIQGYNFDNRNNEPTSRSTAHNPNAHLWGVAPQAPAHETHHQPSYHINNFPYDRAPAQPRSGTTASAASFAGVPWERRF